MNPSAEIFIDILDDKPSKLLDDFIESYSKDYSINKSKTKEMIADLKAYVSDRKNVEKRKRLIYINKLEDRWYKSLKRISDPDYSVYDDDYYFVDLWVCWIAYSRRYLQALRSNKLLLNGRDRANTADTIIDLGCGLGYTTASIKKLFPDSAVFGTNLENTKQYKYCKRMSLLHDFSIIPNLNNFEKSADIIFAFEYFEHIFNPVDHLRQVVEQAKKPILLYIANSFNTKSIGHFTYYKVGNKYVDQSEISRIFNKSLRYIGYRKIKTKL